VLNTIGRGDKRGGSADGLSSQVRQKISEMIHNRTLQGGQDIIEQRIAEQMGVSRTPLREALQRLEGEGMVQKGSGRRSYQVRKVDFQEYLQSLRVRQMLEPEAAAMSVGRIPDSELAALQQEMVALKDLPFEHTSQHWQSDDHLHRLIAARCGNKVLNETIEKLRVTTRLFEIEDSRQRVDKDLEQHLEVINAIADGDADRARTAMKTHIESLITHSLSQIG